MDSCLFCKKKPLIIKFFCLDGPVCKSCYKLVSMNYSQTIKQKTLVELEEILNLHATNLNMGTQDLYAKSFKVSRSINPMILFDDESEVFCLPNHAKYSQAVMKPEVYAYSDIIDCRAFLPEFSKRIGKKDRRIGTIEVRLYFNHNLQRSIWLLPNPIQTESNMYRTMALLADKIILEIKKITPIK